jgi:hypothetical protein
MIYVHIPSDDSTSAYADRCEREMIRRAASPEDLRFKRYATAAAGSVGHANALTQIFQSLIPGHINVVADSDTAVVMQWWDRVIADLLRETGCVATQYDAIDRFPHNGSLIQSYKGSPHFIWAALSPDHDFSGLDFSGTNTGRSILIQTAEDSTLYGLPIGHSLVCEAGHQTPRYFRDNGIPFKLLGHSVGRPVLGSLPPYHEEYELGGHPFVVHQRGSRKHPYNQGRSKRFYDAVDSWGRLLDQAINLVGGLQPR